jgi:hypothetical protein
MTKSKAKYLIPVILAVWLFPFVGTGSVLAQETITAEVDRTALTTDEMLLLTVMLNAPALGTLTPKLPTLQGFNVVGSSTSSQISIVNGDVSSQLVYVYRLQPYETGDLVIEPISVVIGGATLSTRPITVRVTQGTGVAAATPSPRQPAVTSSPTELMGQDLFVEAEVDNPAPYVGQQVVYTFRFYRAADGWGQITFWDQPTYEAPVFTGFWSEHQSDRYEYQVQAAGRVYEVTELQTILFPSVLGLVTIDPARLTISSSFFRSGQTLQTQPIDLEVRQLPPDAPQGFNGAVGQFALAGTVDVAQGRVNEPLTWRITLDGQGNLSAVPDPVWPEMPGWRDFESSATIHTEVQDGQVVGSRTYERLLIPSTEGEFTIPPLKYVYFDPVVRQYQTIRTASIPVSIAPEISVAGDSGTPARHLPTGNPRAVGQGEVLEQLATDIRHLKPVPLGLGVVDRPVSSSTLYWVAWAFPALGAMGYFAWQRRQRHLENNLGLVRSFQARKKARKELAQARKQGQDGYSSVGQIVMAYLADKLDQPVAGLTHQGLAHLLAQQGVRADLVERVGVLLVSSELGRFAPGADHPDHAQSLLQETEILIDALEKVL